MGAPRNAERSVLQGGSVVIFVTVGEQLPFDRLIRAMDQWAAQRHEKIFAQIGSSAYKPNHLQFKNFLEHDEYRIKMQEAQLIVGHAGMGTIISAIEMGKPIIVMPRKASLGEHRNDHQLATARRFSSLEFVSVAFDENQLFEKIGNSDTLWQRDLRGISGPSSLLIQSIRDFITH